MGYAKGLNQIFDDMGLESDDDPLDAALGADGLGMDSQEIVELYGRLRPKPRVRRSPQFASSHDDRR